MKAQVEWSPDPNAEGEMVLTAAPMMMTIARNEDYSQTPSMSSLRPLLLWQQTCRYFVRRQYLVDPAPLRCKCIETLQAYNLSESKQHKYPPLPISICNLSHVPSRWIHPRSCRLLLHSFMYASSSTSISMSKYRSSESVAPPMTTMLTNTMTITAAVNSSA
jgi:hypothetical protein